MPEETLSTEISTGGSAESAALPAASENGAGDMDASFFDGFGLSTEEKPEHEETGEAAPAEGENETGAASEEPPAEEIPPVEFTEHGRTISVDGKTFEDFAKAVGLPKDGLIEVIQKGKGFDGVAERLARAEEDAKLIADLSKASGMDKNAIQSYIRERVEAVPVEKAFAELRTKYPDAPEELIRQMAQTQVSKEKLEAERAAKEAPAIGEETKAQLTAKVSEITAFQERHPEFKTSDVPQEVIDDFKAGVPLEKAFGAWQTAQDKAALERQLAEAKKEKEKTEKLNFNLVHAPGSATAAAGERTVDPFIAGLFGDK